MAEGKTEAMARQLAAAQAITHVGSWEWDVATGSVAWSAELYRIYGLPHDKAITLDVFLASLHPDDRERIQGEIGAAMAAGGRFAYRERIRRPDGSIRVLDTIGEVVAGPDGKPTSLLGTCRDVTEEVERADARQRAQRVEACERQALELLASGAPLANVLAVIVKLIEELSPGTTASIFIIDERGERLHHGTAPSPPDDHDRALDGNATKLPIATSDGQIVGTLAVSYREPRAPDDQAVDLIKRAAHVASIAIERRLLDDQLRALSERIEAVREDERTNIAREIHDELGQALTALKLDIAWVLHRTQGDVATKLAEMSRSTDGIIDAVRRISAELRPGILDAIGLRAALEWQAEDVTRRLGIVCRVESTIGDLRLERSLATAVFRIYQEALTNVVRHAKATHVDVKLWLEHGNLRLEIADDGVGIPEIAPRRMSLGLLGMRERARRYAGECTIRRRDPHGTVVSVSVPLRFPAERDEVLGA